MYKIGDRVISCKHGPGTILSVIDGAPPIGVKHDSYAKSLHNLGYDNVYCEEGYGWYYFAHELWMYHENKAVKMFMEDII